MGCCRVWLELRGRGASGWVGAPVGEHAGDEDDTDDEDDNNGDDGGNDDADEFEHGT